MKVLALIVCVCYLSVLAQAAISEENKQKLKTIREECQANPETHLDKEIIDKLIKGEEVDRTKLGAHSLCLAKKLHLVKDNGEVDQEVLKKILKHGIADEATLNKTVQECSVKQSTDEETALKVQKCFYDHVGRQVFARHREDHH